MQVCEHAGYSTTASRVRWKLSRNGFLSYVAEERANCLFRALELDFDARGALLAAYLYSTTSRLTHIGDGRSLDATFTARQMSAAIVCIRIWNAHVHAVHGAVDFTDMVGSRFDMKVEVVTLERRTTHLWALLFSSLSLSLTLFSLRYLQALCFISSQRRSIVFLAAF